MTRRIRVVAAMVVGAFLAVAVLMGAGRLLASTLAENDVPKIVNYQGYLTDGSGPVSGTVSIEFRIFDASSGGSQVWSETHPTVTVSSGYFSVYLGSEGSPLTPSVFSNSSRYLEIEYNGTIFARQRFASVPYALVAQQATQAITSTYAMTAAYAMNAPSSSSGVDWQYVKIVAKSGGDYTSISDAMSAISPTSSSRYLVLVMPGVYEEQVTLKEYVHLKGSGTKSTIVRIAGTDTNPTDAGAYVMQVPANSQVSDLAVVNTGTSDSSVGVRVENGTNSILDNVYVAVTGTTGVNHYAVLSRSGNGTPHFHHVYAIASGAATRNAGMFVNASKPSFDDSQFYAKDGDFTWGIRVAGGELTLQDTIISGLNGSDGEGISTSAGSGTQNIKVDRSSVIGDSGGHSFSLTDNYYAFVGASLVDGGDPSLAGFPDVDITCVYAYSGDYTELDANCDAP